MQNEWQFCLGMHLHPGGRLLFNPGCRCKSENEWLALTLYTFRLNAWMGRAIQSTMSSSTFLHFVYIPVWKNKYIYFGENFAREDCAGERSWHPHDGPHGAAACMHAGGHTWSIWLSQAANRAKKPGHVVRDLINRTTTVSWIGSTKLPPRICGRGSVSLAEGARQAYAWMGPSNGIQWLRYSEQGHDLLKE